MAKKALTWELFKLSGVDVRKYGLTDEEATDILDVMKAIGRCEFTKEGFEPVRLVNKAFNKPDYQAIYDLAVEAGQKAGDEAIPKPMTVQQHSNMADDNSAVVKQWYVPEGACGFGWVSIKGNTSFAKWLKKQGIVKSVAYGGGYDLWCGLFGQSVDRKYAWAMAVAKVLNDNGIEAIPHSRLD